MSVGVCVRRFQRERVRARVCICAWERVRVCACARVRVCVVRARAHARANLHAHIYKHAYTRPWLQIHKLYTNGFNIPHLLPLPHCPHATPPSNQRHAAEMAFQKRNSARATVMRTHNDGDEVILRLSRAGRDGITNSSSKGCAHSEASSAHTNLRISMSPGPPPAPPTPLPAPTPPPVPSLLLLRMPLTAERRGRAVS